MCRCGKGFLDWRAFSNSQPDMAIGRSMARACPHLTAAEAAAYDAPYPDARYKAGVRRFPNLVPEFADSPAPPIGRAARDFWRNDLDRDEASWRSAWPTRCSARR